MSKTLEVILFSLNAKLQTLSTSSERTLPIFTNGKYNLPQNISTTCGSCGYCIVNVNPSFFFHSQKHYRKKNNNFHVFHTHPKFSKFTVQWVKIVIMKLCWDLVKFLITIIWIILKSTIIFELSVVSRTVVDSTPKPTPHQCEKDFPHLVLCVIKVLKCF